MRRKLTYWICFVLLLGLANNAFAEIPRDPNLVIYYSYDDVRAIVPDESGKGHNGTVCGDVSAYPSGIKWYGAAKFLGIWGPAGFSYLDLDSPHYPAVDIPKSAITLSAWAKCRQTGQEHAIISCRAADNTWVVHPQINNDGTFRWLLRAKGSVTIFNLNGVGKHGWDEWLHYAGTYDSVTGKGILYINGEVCASIDVPRGQYIADWGTGARVGYNIDNARPFTGLMDELYLFTRALSQAEIKDLMVSEALPSEKASHPKPGNGTEIETTGTDLLWLPGAYAVSNNVYFGNNFEDVNNGTGGTFKGNQTEAQFTVDGLVWGTTYYWRIDGVNTVDPNSPWKGNVWSFLLRPQTAWNPNPPDGAKWVDPNAALSWSPGRGAVMHYVYFGDNFDVVNNAAGAPPQTQTTYDPGPPLGFEKVYYWRVDEFDGSATYKGNIWRFTTMRSGSGIKGQYYKEELKTLVLTRVDPGINFDWGSAAPDLKVPADNFSVRWTGELEVPFTQTWTFTTSCDDNVRLWVNNKLLIDRWIGEQGGVEWIGEINLTEGQKYSIVMEYYENTGDARAKLYWNTPSWLSPYQPKQIIPQGAFSLPLWARNPKPPQGATDVKHTPKLVWVAGDNAAKHNVYFGTDETVVANATAASAGIYRGQQDLAATSYVPSEAPLAWNKTYYWRIDEVNAVDAWKGHVWSFTTANFVVVDDFEDYTDDVGSRIFQTWRDGFGFTEPAPGYPGNGTGSAVGYAQAPFAEQTIVHGGGQSMPLGYDNSGTGGKTRYSETQREWASPQDWTINNVKASTLWFCGDPNNAAEQFYVAVEDNAGHVKVVNYPDVAAVQKIAWQEWNIELTQFSTASVNLAAVKKMYIGLGNRTSPTTGGTGTIFIDDIGVYPSRCIPSKGKPAADLSGNCVVDYADLDIMANEWLDKGVAVVADLDGDDDVDAKDFAVLADAWLEEVLWP
jgi:hypothetical protein